MKRIRIRPVLISFLAVGAVGTWGAETRESKANHAQTVARVRMVSEAGEQRLQDFMNRPVLNIAGTTLGTLQDFLLDRTSGRLAYAVVDIPHAALHERRRLLGGDALRWNPTAKSFEVEAAAEVPTDESEGILQHNTFLRASSLPGHAVRSGERTIGRIADVVFDIATRTAAPVLRPDPSVLRTQRSFVLPLSRVRLAAPETVVTTVTPEELARIEVAVMPVAVDGSLPASPVTGASGISQSSVTGQTGYSTPQTAKAATTESTDAGVLDESLKPTGRAGREGPEPGVLARAAQSVREALLAANSSAGARVEVAVENGTIVLRGTVPSNAVKDQLEHAASAAARAVPVESRLSASTQTR